MVSKQALWGVLFAGALVIGCEEKKETPASVIPAPTNPTPSTPSEPKVDAGAVKEAVKETTAQAQTTAGNMETDAKAILDEVAGYVKDKKFDLADQAIAKLEAMKDKLTPETQGRIDQVKTLLATSRNLQIPALNK